MLSQFQQFYLNKLLTETYHKYYVPYYLTEAKQGGGRKRTTCAKGGKIEPNDDDREFVSDLIRQAPNLSTSKALMLLYQLLGGGIHSVRERPGEPEGAGNTTFAWIENKTDPDESGWVAATLTLKGSGKSKNTAKVRANIGGLKKRLEAAGYNTSDQCALENFLHTPWKTWRKRIADDKDAPEGAKYKFSIKPFGGDYHATQVAASADFKEKMDTDSEFAKKIAEMAVRAASNATGIPVSNVNGFNYNSSAKSHAKTGLTNSDLDDAIQAAISFMSSQSATEPEKLSDDDWLRVKLASGAKSYVQGITTRNKERAAGDQGNEKGGSLDATADKGWSAIRDDDPDAYDPDRDGAPEEPPGHVEPTKHSIQPKFADVGDLEMELRHVKDALKDPRLSGEKRKELIRRGMQIEDDLEMARSDQDSKKGIGSFLNKFNTPKTPVAVRKPVTAIPDAQPNAMGWSMGHDDDDVADPADVLKYRRRMSAEGFTFGNYLNFKEMLGATGAIYDGTKGKDFQWEGDPKSMRKIRKK